MLPNDISKRDLVKNYLQEALQHSNNKDLAELKLKEVFDSVKESEDSTGFSLSEFKESLAAARNYDKVQAIVDKKQSALEVIDTLQL